MSTRSHWRVQSLYPTPYRDNVVNVAKNILFILQVQNTQKVSRYNSDRLIIAHIDILFAFFSLYLYQFNFEMTP